MPVSLDDYIAKLPEDRQRRIEEGTAKLIAEEATLRELREISSRSQHDLAKRLNVNQPALSRMERRTDIYVGSLRRYIEALGGELIITAKLPGRDPIVISQFRDISAGDVRDTSTENSAMIINTEASGPQSV